MDVDDELGEYIAIESSANPVFTEYFTLYNRKLWHQLGVKLEEASTEEYFQIDQRLLHMYNKFVAKCAPHLSKQLLARFIIAASHQHPETVEGLSFLQKALPLVEDEPQAKVLLSMEIARYKTRAADVEGAKQLVLEGKKQIEGYVGIMDPPVYSKYYRAALELYKVTGPASEYYQNSVLYLTYTKLGSIPRDEQLALAADLALAALIGENIYNFGELLQQQLPFLLRGTQKQWLLDMLSAFNAGNIAQFKELYAAHHKEQPELERSAAFLNEKVRIMALMEMVFNRESTKRALGFEEIAKVCDLTNDQVELLVMRALSLGVVRGKIDQVDQRVYFRWVEPRVLAVSSIAGMRSRLGAWSAHVDQAANLLRDGAPDLLHPDS